MSDSTIRNISEIASSTVQIAVTITIGYYLVKVINKFLEFEDGKADNTSIIKKLAKRLNRPEVETLTFDKYETKLINDVIGPDEISVTFDNIGGLDAEIQEIQDNIVVPLSLWSLNSLDKSNLNLSWEYLKSCSNVPTGLLLYGRPGTGKSLLAKAIAKETGCTFINIKSSSLMDKWLGETDKLVLALFSLARKLAPSVIFIDEIETLLRKRGASGNTHAVQSMQGIFLAEWDGLSSSSSSSTNAFNKDAPILVMGATNRPGDIDEAFMRRMPLQINVPLPNSKAREEILLALLKSEVNPFENEVTGQKPAAPLNLSLFSAVTEGFSGSDLRELVRIASSSRTAEFTKNAKNLLNSMKNKGQVNGSFDIENGLRPYENHDFEFALKKLKGVKGTTNSFSNEILKEDILIKIPELSAELKEIGSNAGSSSA